MLKEISKNLMCISVRNGINVYIEKDLLETLKPALESKRFIEVNDQIINTADIMGIFKASEIEDILKRKNGQWKCKFGTWHERGTTCGCWNVLGTIKEQPWSKKY